MNEMLGRPILEWLLLLLLLRCKNGTVIALVAITLYSRIAVLFSCWVAGATVLKYGRVGWL